MAAEGYARITGTPGILNVTTGPGSINALNGVFGAWTDSIPMLIVSGQVKRETCMSTYGLTDLRQLGDQEVDIVRMVSGITKYAVLVHEPEIDRVSPRAGLVSGPKWTAGALLARYPCGCPIGAVRSGQLAPLRSVRRCTSVRPRRGGKAG